jgi:Family of unknown function (DUF6788)
MTTTVTRTHRLAGNPPSGPRLVPRLIRGSDETGSGERLRVCDTKAAGCPGGFRPGSVNVTYRRCGKPNCICAQDGHPGHGPRYLWTRSAGGRTRSRQLRGAELGKVRQEVANYREFLAVSEQIVEVSEAICEARPPGESAPPAPLVGSVKPE